MEKFNELETYLQTLKDDADKFYNKDNKAAGVRLTKGMQTLKALAQEVRKDVFTKNKN